MRTGIDENTGQVLTGWAHCVQSLGKILTTRINSRVMHRHLGFEGAELQDANANPRTLFELYIALAEAIDDPRDGEPGFVLQTIEMVEGGRSGKFIFEIAGLFFPRGHLGDYEIRESRSVAIGVAP